LISLLILTLFYALFSLILPRDPNGKGWPRKHLLLARQRRLLQSFLLYFIVVCMNVGFLPSSACRMIRPFCITILYHNLLLFIDIFHI
jgi:hypothetical protein